MRDRRCDLQPLWTGGAGPIYGSPALANGVVYVGSQAFDPSLFAFSASGCGAATCNPQWGGHSGVVDGSMTVANGVVYVGSYDYTSGSNPLSAFNAAGCGGFSTCPRLSHGSTGSDTFTFSSPAAANGMLYVGSHEGTFYAFATPGLGSPLWTATTGAAIESSPAVANGVVYVGSGNKLYAFNAAGCGGFSTCTPLWTATTGAQVNSSPAVANGVVYVGSQDGQLYAFNAAGCGGSSCSPLWTGGTGGGILSSPAVANGLVYVGADDAKLYAFSASGCGSLSCTPLWSAATGGPIYSSPAVANGMVYVGSYDGKLYAYGLPPSPPPPVHPTSTTVSCSPTTVSVGRSTTCTATVTDTASSGQTTPTGFVSFTTDSFGSWSPGSVCDLAGSGASASCQVTYTPLGVGFAGAHKITAAYGGDATLHVASSGSTTVTIAQTSSPTNLQILVHNGGVTATWQPPVYRGTSPIIGYVVTATPTYTDRAPDPKAPVVLKTVSSTTRSFQLTGLVEDCHQLYQLSVKAMNAAGAGDEAASDEFRPSGIVIPGTDPPYVVILLDGVRESQPGFTMKPYKPTVDNTLVNPPSYCPESWHASSNREGEADFASAPSGPWSFFHKWNFGEVDNPNTGISNGLPSSNNPDGTTPNTESEPRALQNNSQGIPVGDQTHSFMLDALAAHGAMVLPFSYKGFGFSPNFSSNPAFTYDGYPNSQALPGLGPPIQQDAHLLAAEVNAAASTWPSSRIVVIGHSQGGLIAWEWWLCSQSRVGECSPRTYGARTKVPAQFFYGFSLDSPINGVCAGNNSPSGGPCFGPPSYPNYLDRQTDDPKFLAIDRARGWHFRFIGTYGDNPAGGYQLAGQSLEHQLLFDYNHPYTQFGIESLCSNSLQVGGCPASVPPDHISECPVANDPDNDNDNNLNDTDGDGDGPPLMASWETAHYVENFCPGNVAYFNKTLGLSY